MTLAFSDKRVTGKYFYLSRLADIRVEGEFSDGRSLIINEYDRSGRVTARFVGAFVEEDPQEHYGPGNKLQCEVMVGHWEDLRSKRTHQVYLNAAHSRLASIDNQYARSGIAESDHHIEEFAQRFVKGVREDNRRVVAGMIHYPFNLHVEGVGIRRIRDHADLLKSYDVLFTKNYKERLFGGIPKHMAIDKYGFISLGHGSSAWIGPDMKIWPLGQT